MREFSAVEQLGSVDVGNVVAEACLPGAIGVGVRPFNVKLGKTFLALGEQLLSLLPGGQGLLLGLQFRFLADGLGLLSAATEKKRIPTLEPDHLQPTAGALDHAFDDLLLGHIHNPGALPDIDKLSVCTGPLESGRWDQPVVVDDVGSSDQLQRAGRHQPWITRAGTDDVDAAI